VRLKFFFDTVEHTEANPVAKALIDGVSFAEVFRQDSPSAPVFDDVLEGLKKSQVIHSDGASRLRKKMLNTFDSRDCPNHNER
jgi:hypothetical protein